MTKLRLKVHNKSIAKNKKFLKKLFPRKNKIGPLLKKPRKSFSGKQIINMHGMKNWFEKPNSFHSYFILSQKIDGMLGWSVIVKFM